MTELNTLGDHATRFYENLIDAVVTWAPRILFGIVIVVLLLLVAKLAEVLIRSALRRVRFDELLEKGSVREGLRRIGLRQAPSRLLSRLAYWLLLFLFVQTAADAFGLTPISNGIGALLGCMPNLISAVLILQVGILAGQFVGRAVGNAARESGIDFASALGKLVSGLILLLAGVMAISQQRIDTDIIRIVTVCTLASLALAFGLSFGLGTRGITRNIIAGFYARKVLRMGESVEIRGERGTLTAITPTQVLLDRDGQTIAISNSAFLEDVIRQLAPPGARPAVSSQAT